MNNAELASAIEKLDEIYTQLWDRGFRKEAMAIDAVAEELNNALIDRLEMEHE